MAFQALNGYLAFPTPHFGTSNFVPTNMAIDAANEKAAFIFKAPKTGNIHKVHYRVVLYSSTGTLDVRLETVDAATGMPTGTLWGANTNVSDAPSSTGWRVCTLTADAAVTKGDVLALVVSQPAVSPGNINVGYLSSNGTGFPYTALYTGSWAKSGVNQGGMGAVEYDDGSFKQTTGLVPWKTNTTLNFSSASSPNYRGLRFSLPVAFRLRGFWIYFRTTTSSVVTVKLYDSDGATVLCSVALDTDQSSGTGILPRLVEFSSDIDLLPNTYYRLVAVPDAVSTDVFENTVHAAGLMDAYGIGRTGHLTTATNPTVEGSWTQDLVTCPMMGLLFSAFDDAAVVPGNMLTTAGMTGGMKG